MTDVRIDGIGPIRYTPLGKPLLPQTAPEDFQQTLKTAVREVNALQVNAKEQVDRLVAGEEVDLHDVMISAEEAGVAFDLMMEIRNKLLEAYQEIQRMSI
jgi:flagellar hook-basal body complex protein FliE